MLVKNVGPFDAVDIFVNGAWIEVGRDPVDVPAEVAGKAPSAAHRKARTEIERIQAAKDAGEVGLDRDHLVAIEAYHDSDWGEGLLAQDANWVHVVASKKDGDQ